MLFFLIPQDIQKCSSVWWCMRSCPICVGIYLVHPRELILSPGQLIFLCHPLMLYTCLHMFTWFGLFHNFRYIKPPFHTKYRRITETHSKYPEYLFQVLLSKQIITQVELSFWSKALVPKETKDLFLVCLCRVPLYMSFLFNLIHG